MTRYVAILVLVSLAACGKPKPALPDLDIYNIKQGLMRADPLGLWRVYEPATVVSTTPNGECVAVGVRKPCVWYGVEFDYELRAERVTLDCTAVFAEPSNVITTTALRAADAREFRYTRELEGRKGHIAQPGYMIADGDATPISHEVKCLHDGKVALTYKFGETK